jgi:hypothetical protein
MNRTNSAGFVPVSLILNIVLAILLVAAGGFGIWAFMNYQDHKNNVDAKVADAVVIAKEEQAKEDEVTFAEKEKMPTRQLTGPVDLGALSLEFPKTWSVYLANNGGNNQFEAFLNPGAIASLSSGTPYALQVNVINNSYETTVAGYQAQVKEGALKSSTIKLNDVDGLRLDGKFSDSVNGSMVLFKIRDKTLRLLTQTPNFVSDFDKIILPSLKFNK